MDANTKTGFAAYLANVIRVLDAAERDHFDDQELRGPAMGSTSCGG